jgi:hypothetical protein
MKTPMVVSGLPRVRSLLRAAAIASVAALPLGLSACKKNEPAPPAASSTEKPTAPAEAAKTPEPATEAPPPATEAAAPQNAAGDGVAEKKSDGECPKSLGGTDEVDRLIKGECGVVPVTAEYRVEGGTLTIEAGATLSFAPGARLVIGEWKTGKLVVKGTPEKPVTFTASGDKVPGSWAGVFIGANGDRSTLDGLVIEHAGGADDGALTVSGAEEVTLRGSTIRSAKSVGVLATGDGVQLGMISGTSFEGVGQAAMRLPLSCTGAVATDNVFPKDATGVVQVVGGAVDRAINWKPLGAPWIVLGELRVEGQNGQSPTWIIEGPNTVKFARDARIVVGEWSRGQLTTTGTETGPVVFGPLEGQEPGSWDGFHVGGNGVLDVTGTTFELGGSGENGVLWAADAAQVTIKASTFRMNQKNVGFGAAAKIKAFENNQFVVRGADPAGPLVGVPPLRLAASSVKALGAGNRWGEGSFIAVTDAATGPEAGTWKNPGAPLRLEHGLQVQSALTIDAGTVLQLADGQGVQVGEWERATLDAKGTAEAPVVFEGVRPEAGAWLGITVHGQGTATLTHVAVRHAGDTGIATNGAATVKLDQVVGSKLTGATVAWGCEAKVERVGVTTADGTAAAERAPEGCTP